MRKKNRISKLLKKAVKLDLWAFVEVRKADETQYEFEIVITENSSYF